MAGIADAEIERLDEPPRSGNGHVVLLRGELGHQEHRYCGGVGVPNAMVLA